MAADAPLQFFHGLIQERLHLPKALATTNVVEEIAENSGAVGRVADLGMKLQTENGPLPVPHRGDRASVRGGQRLKITVDGLDLVAVAHPDNGIFGDARKESVRLFDMTMGAAEFPAGRRFDLAAEGLTSQLHAIADSQDREPKTKDFRIAARRTGFINAGRSPGQD